MSNMVMKDANENTWPLIELSAKEFAEMKKKIGDVAGRPIYWAEGIGVLPKPAEFCFMFTLED